MTAFHNQFNAHFWLEVMLLKGINGTEEQRKMLHSVLNDVHPGRVFGLSPISHRQRSGAPVQNLNGPGLHNSCRQMNSTIVYDNASIHDDLVSAVLTQVLTAIRRSRFANTGIMVRRWY